MHQLEIINCQQGSDEWYKHRLGCITASRFSDVLSKGAGKTRASYMEHLAAEILTGIPTETFNNQAMREGTEKEQEARKMYIDTISKNISFEEYLALDIREVGFLKIKDRNIGASPDFLVGSVGGGEIKCPLQHTHLSNFLRNGIPPQYKSQIQGNLWISGRVWWDFVSYHPNFPINNQLRIIRVNRDEEYINMLSTEVYIFEQELKEMINKIRR